VPEVLEGGGGVRIGGARTCNGTVEEGRVKDGGRGVKQVRVEAKGVQSIESMTEVSNHAAATPH
jgi:hypothetical protein